MPKVIKKKAQAKSDQVVEIAIGASGTQFFKGFFNIQDADEYAPDLQGDKALKIYNRMRRGDAQCRLALLALVHPIVNATWKIQPAGDPEKEDAPTAEEQEAARLINKWWFDDKFQWELALRQILSFFWAGFSVFEKLYIYEDGFIKPKKLSQRLPTTIVEWAVENEQLQAIRQQITGGVTARDVWIPADKLVLFTYDQEGDDFRGQSVFRAAYKHWFFKDTYYRIQGIKIERWSLGIPRVKQTEMIVGSTAKSKAIETVKNMRAHEEAYIFQPKGFEIDLVDSGSAKMVDEQPAIEHHDKAILKCVLAQFLELGLNDTGSRAVGTTLKDFYLQGLSFAANYVCEIIRSQVLEELTLWNFGEKVRPPHLIFEGIQPIDLKLLAEAYGIMVRDGAIEMDDPTEAHIRNQTGLPEKDVETVRKKASPIMPGDPNQKPNPKEEEEENDDDAEEDESVEEEEESNPEDENPKESKPNKSLKANAPLPHVAKGMEAETYVYFRRPLRPSEECISFREIVGHVDDSRESLVRATRKVRAEVVEVLIAKIDDAVQSKNPIKVQKIDYGNDLTNKLLGEVKPILNELVDYGRKQVALEINRQKDRIAAKLDPLKKLQKLAAQYLDAKAMQFTEISLDKMVDEARKQASDALRTGLYDVAAIREALEVFSENTVRKSAGHTVNEAFSFGRIEGAKEHEDEIAYAEYTSVLDSGTCAPCERLDGQQFAIDSPEFQQYTPPLSTCEGGSQCRCIWIFVYKSERTAQA